MSMRLSSLVRDGFLRPRIAARYLVDLNLSTTVVLQAAILLAILHTLSLYFVFDMIEKYSPTTVRVIGVPLMSGVMTQVGFIALCGYMVCLLSNAFGDKPTYPASLTIFIWFNLLQLGGSVAGLLVVLILGPLAFFVPLVPLAWTLWAAGRYWGELVGNESNFIGFVLVAAAILITLPIMALITAILGLPTAGIITDV